MAGKQRTGGERGERSDDYDPDNLRDNRTPSDWRAHHRSLIAQRELELVAKEGVYRRRDDGRPLEVLSVGCGSEPRVGIPAGDHHVVGVDSDPAAVERARVRGNGQVVLGSATALPVEAGSIDVVVYRLVLHHVVDQTPLLGVLQEAHRALRPRGRLVAIEPNLFHPLGALLYGANLLGWSKRIKGTADDWPLSPVALERDLRRAGFGKTRIIGLEYSWRRLPPPLQRMLRCFEPIADWPVVKFACHTFLAIGEK